MSTLLANGGPVIWLILIAAATAAVVFVERALFCHRSQINSAPRIRQRCIHPQVHVLCRAGFERGSEMVGEAAAS